MITCNCCGKPISSKAINTPYKVDGSRIMGVYACNHCGAVQGTCYKGESYMIVKPQWHQGPEDPSNTCYFDLTVLEGAGSERRHGWFDKTTRGITQVG